ncbi:ubiquitin-domain-containing protein [Hyaloscypha variabilis F]|uniref:Ubiquitin-domain-containing protein n=1 Tax=Hyaloscypha variabilis (strain UAMH 11265 / GT02V1 / F) TaxID=1149755 RepID=A0A2J6RIE4_HYAVF|nr:ubiquitin-domain-containing protein [Hyaloscypha variabilis F]
MSADDAPVPDTEVTFKVKTSSDGQHTVTMAESATVLDLKTKLSGGDFENVAVDRMRLIYSGRVMKDPEPLSTYKIKAGNTVHMVKSAQSNAAQNPASANPSTAGSAARAAPGVPTNMAAGTANNPLAGLTGARYAGHMGLPGAEMFGADGGMGAPPSEDAIASMLEDPNLQQSLNEALNNPAMIDMMIQQAPGLRDNPHAREMLQSPEFRRMMTNPEAIRQAAQLRRMMGGGAGANAFPAPGVTDTTPAGAAGSAPNAAAPFNPFGAAPTGPNPFAALFGGMPGAGTTPAQSPPLPGSAGQGTPGAGNDAPANPANPFGSLFGAPGAGGAFPFPQGITPEMMQQAQQMAASGQFNDLFGGQNPFAAFGGGAGGVGGATSPPPPADTRPPEERYADQLRQLNDMGFYDFDQNVAALRRAGGSVQGAIEQLLR